MKLNINMNVVTKQLKREERLSDQTTTIIIIRLINDE